MLRKCKREDCYEHSIKRGKYCMNHCTVRKYRTLAVPTPVPTTEHTSPPIRSHSPAPFGNIFNEEEERKDIFNEERKCENEFRYIEDRMIIQEQNREYEEAYKKDLENLHRMEEMLNKEKEMKLKFEIEIEKKRRQNESRENDEFYKIKFVFSNLNGLTIISTFSKDDIFENVFNFIDVFLYDASINIGDYELISYPRIILNKVDHDLIKIKDKINSKNIQFMIKEKEIE